jgi:hypothetical protein
VRSNPTKKPASTKKYPVWSQSWRGFYLFPFLNFTLNPYQLTTRENLRVRCHSPPKITLELAASDSKCVDPFPATAPIEAEREACIIVCGWLGGWGTIMLSCTQCNSTSILHTALLVALIMQSFHIKHATEHSVYYKLRVVVFVFIEKGHAPPPHWNNIIVTICCRINTALRWIYLPAAIMYLQPQQGNVFVYSHSSPADRLFVFASEPQWKTMCLQHFSARHLQTFNFISLSLVRATLLVVLNKPMWLGLLRCPC